MYKEGDKCRDNSDKKNLESKELSGKVGINLRIIIK